MGVAGGTGALVCGTAAVTGGGAAAAVAVNKTSITIHTFEAVSKQRNENYSS